MITVLSADTVELDFGSLDPKSSWTMDSLDATSSEKAKPLEKRTKLRRSCELCRASKGRCIPSKEDSNKCQKCLKDRKSCVFLEAKPRPKRSKKSRTRVAEMEQRLDGLYALLSSAAATKMSKEKEVVSPPSPPQPRTPAQIEAPPHHFNEMLATYTAPRVSIEAPRFSEQDPIWIFPHIVFDDIQDVITKGLLDIREAAESLLSFRTKASGFPFLIVSPRTSLDSMRRQKPFLLLTILTWGAHETFKLQRTLDLEIREQLSRRVIVNGEKNMDLLQGILVYLCWYQFYFKPERQQVYQLSQMAASMAIDLGIHQPTKSAAQLNNFTILNTMPQVFNPRKSPEEIEAKRTFLGCYYLSSSTALGLRKPTTLKYTQYVEDCAQILSQIGDAVTDYLLPHFIALQKFAEEVNHTFDYNAALQHPQMDSMRVELLSRTFGQQLDHLHSSFPPALWNNVQISMSYHFLRVYINEVGFHASAPSPLELMSGQSNLRVWYFSNARNDSLIACLQAAKNYLDHFIELTPQQTFDFTLPDYLRLVYAVVVLGRFTTGCDCPLLDASAIRKTANMGYYLDKLAEKSTDLINLVKDRDVNDTFYHLRRLWNQSKQWFDEIVKNPACARECSIGQPELAFMEILPAAIGKCVEFSGAKMCDEKWTDMLSFDASLDSMYEGFEL